MDGFSIKNLQGTPLAVLGLVVLAVLGMVGLAFAFKGSVQL